MSRSLLVVAGLVWGSCWAGVRPAAAAEPSLASIVPSDVHFYGHWRSTPEQSRLLEPYAKAVRRLVDSGIGRDIFDLATLDMPSWQRDEARAIAQRVIEIVKTPRWGKLIEKEIAGAFRLAIPLPEYLYLFRVPPEDAAGHVEDLKRMLDGIVEFAPQNLQVSDASRTGGQVYKLQAMGIPMAISVAAKAHVVAITTSDRLLDRCLELLDSADAVGSIAKDPRFQAALDGLGPGDNSQAFLDLEGYFSFLKGMVGMATMSLSHDANAVGALTIVQSVIDEIARMERMGSVGRTDGRRMISSTKIQLGQEGGPGFIEGLIRDQEPLRDFHRIVPRDALAFYLSAGVDLARVYDALTASIREKIPVGEQILQQWEAIQQHVGFHLRDDLLAWCQGGFGYVVLPAASGGCADLVGFLRVRDDEKAREMVGGAQRLVGRFLQSRGLKAELVPMDDLGEDFKVVRIEALPWLRLVIGTPSGVLVLGSSPEAVRRVAATFRGEDPDFSENPAWKLLEVPEGPLCEVFYHDVQNSMAGLANLVGGAGFAASLLPDEQDTRHVRKLGAILVKLSRFLRDVDLGVDYGGWTRYDGERHAIHAWQMARVKEPAGEE